MSERFLNQRIGDRVTGSISLILISNNQCDSKKEMLKGKELQDQRENKGLSNYRTTKGLALSSQQILFTTDRVSVAPQEVPAGW